jgi:hypothetical protein
MQPVQHPAPAGCILFDELGDPQFINQLLGNCDIVQRVGNRYHMYVDWNFSQTFPI